MKYYTTIISIFMLLCFASIFYYTEAKQLSTMNKQKRRNEKAQREYNDKLMKKNTININDRIIYNKLLTTPFLESICPIVSELVFMDETNLYELHQVTRDEFQNAMIQNVSHVFLSDVYTSKNYPTHRHDVLLNITVADIYKYNKNHCIKEYKKFKYLKKETQQKVHEYRIQKTNIITIDQGPYYHIKDYKFQKTLCPIIGAYKRMNETFSTRENYVNSLVNNITIEYMLQVYTRENFEKLYKNDAILQIPSEEEINIYYKEHCKHLHENNYYTYLSTIVLGSTAALISIL